MSWRGVKLVFKLEILQRIRTTKWYISIIIWALILGFLFLSLTAIVTNQGSHFNSVAKDIADGFSWITLGVCLIISPIIASTSINGDRQRQTLAILQATALTSGDIVFGKFLASCFAASMLIIIASPFILFPAIIAGTVIPHLLGIIVIIILAASICGISLAFSAYINRPVGATSLSLIYVSILVVGLPILFGILVYNTSTHQEVTEYDIQKIPKNELQTFIKNHPSSKVIEETTENVSICTKMVMIYPRFRTDTFLPLIKINPFAQLSAATTLLPSLDHPITSEDTYKLTSRLSFPSGYVTLGINELAQDSSAYTNQIRNFCNPDLPKYTTSQAEIRTLEPYYWYLYTFSLIVIGALGLHLSSRKLQLPMQVLAKGTRVA